MIGRSKLAVLLLGASMATAACGERRDISEMAAGLAPFDQLRGTNIATLRGGQVRAMRANIQPSPLEGYRERLGEWDVVYTSQGFDGSDGSWPQEEVQILEVEATRQVATDSLGRAAWYETAKQIRNATGATPRCLMIHGSGFSLDVVEFDRGGDWRLAVSFAPAVRLPNQDTLSSRVAIAVRRLTLAERFPQRGQPNPDSLPTWSPKEEECRFQ
jgi:hypothetical protein